MLPEVSDPIAHTLGLMECWGNVVEYGAVEGQFSSICFRKVHFSGMVLGSFSEKGAHRPNKFSNLWSKIELKSALKRGSFPQDNPLHI